MLISISKRRKAKKSKGKKKDNPRSKFLSALMTELANHEQIIPSFTSNNRDKFEKAFANLGKALAETLKDKQHD